MLITNTTRDTVIAYKAEVADSLLKRLIGLLNREEFNRGESLIFRNTSSIHTIGMRFPIDVLFVDKNNTIVKAISGMKPFRLSGFYSSCDVIELPAGVIEESKTKHGDKIQVKEV